MFSKTFSNKNLKKIEDSKSEITSDEVEVK